MNPKRHPIPSTLALAIAAVIALATSASAATHRSAANLTGTISVAYSTTYVFDADNLSVTWWNNVKSQFEKAYPRAHLKLEGFDGTDVDLVNKVALLYKSKSTTPDVFMLPTGYVGQWVSSKYLAPLDKYLTKKNATFWKAFPKVIQNESRINGHVYALNTGIDVTVDPSLV